MILMKRIYLDSAAATPSDARVLAAMRPFFSRRFGNPSSLHEEGVAAAAALAAARAKAAEFLGAHPDEIVFTSGGTESNALAWSVVKHSVFNKTDGVEEIITTPVEHASVRETARACEVAGAKVTYLPVDGRGLIDLPALAKSLTAATRLVSVVHGNNETGAIQPVGEIAKIIRHHRKTKSEARSTKFETGPKLFGFRNSDFGFAKTPFLHLDASQTARLLPLKVARLGVDLLTLDAGKLYGPKGVGLLYVRRGVELNPLWRGGGQEAGRRAGTENVPAIVGLARALEIVAAERAREAPRLVATAAHRQCSFADARRRANGFGIGRPRYRLRHRQRLLEWGRRAALCYNGFGSERRGGRARRPLQFRSRDNSSRARLRPQINP